MPSDARTTDGTPPREVPDPLVPERDEWHRRTTLRDGTPILLRQIRATDRQRLVDGLARLSPASRYLRFHAHVDTLTDEQLDHLSDVDHVDHEAIVALDVARPDVPGVGVARYIRDPGEPTVAEAAITVADEYHGRGAGTLLLAALAERARRNDVEVFRSYVLAGNHAMLEVFDHLGADRRLETDGLWRVDLAVPLPDRVPGSPAGHVLRTAARQRRGLASLLPPVWGRGRTRGAAGDEEEDDVLDLGQMQAELAEWLAHRDRR